MTLKVIGSGYGRTGTMSLKLALEQIGLGINDYRYLKTLKAKIEAAKKAGGKDAAVQAAEQFLADTAKAVGLSSDPVASKSLSTPQDTVTLRQQAAKLIQDLAK